FEGRAARRYVAAERCAFGDLDERLLDRFDAELRAARTFLDVGAGTGEFAAKVAARHPHLHVWAIEPSRAFARVAPVRTLRARGGGRGGPARAACRSRRARWISPCS